MKIAPEPCVYMYLCLQDIFLCIPSLSLFQRVLKDPEFGPDLIN